jgi:AcrR family transcriptional regulator
MWCYLIVRQIFMPTRRSEVIPKQTRSRRRREALVKAACDIFLETGYEKTTVDAIVRRAGGSKSAVYAEFGGKEGLFKAAVEALSAEIVLPVAMLDYTGLDLESSLKKFGIALLQYLLRKRILGLDKLILSEVWRYPEVGSSWYKQGPQRMRQACTTLIASHVGERNTGVLPPDRLAARFHDMLVWDSQHRALAGIAVTPAAIRQIVEDSVQILLASMK